MRKYKRNIARHLMEKSGVGGINRKNKWNADKKKWTSYFSLNWRKVLKDGAA